jgi:hypothetical protein
VKFVDDKNSGWEICHPRTYYDENSNPNVEIERFENSTDFVL